MKSIVGIENHFTLDTLFDDYPRKTKKRKEAYVCNDHMLLC